MMVGWCLCSGFLKKKGVCFLDTRPPSIYNQVLFKILFRAKEVTPKCMGWNCIWWEAESVVEGPALFPFPLLGPISHRLGLAAFIPKVWDLSPNPLEWESAKCRLPSFRVGKSFIGAPLLSCSPLYATLSSGCRAIPVQSMGFGAQLTWASVPASLLRSWVT